MVLDGLDEVSVALRRLVQEATWAVINEYSVDRVMVTCRVRSYEGETVLPGFQKHTLAAFDNTKIVRFAHGWYNAQRELGRMHAEQADRKAANLADVAQSEELSELAANPMLEKLAAVWRRTVSGAAPSPRPHASKAWQRRRPAAPRRTGAGHGC